MYVVDTDTEAMSELEAIASLNLKKKGSCSALGNHVFGYGQKGAEYQMHMTGENIVHHVGTIYGHDISNELQEKTKVSIPKPE